MDFKLGQRLADSSHLVSRIDDIQVRIADDSRYVWLLLIPEKAGVVELHDLTGDLRGWLFALAAHLSGWIKTTFTADKINVAAIGNLVPQLHLHIVARLRGDAARPGPVWGHGAPTALSETEKQRLITAIATFLETGEIG